MTRLLFIFILFLTYASCSSINLALASNVSYAIPSLIKEFNKTHPNVKVNITIASSGKLSAQIQNHAPYDIFLSANMKYPWFLYKKELTLTKAKVYAKGSLVMLSKKDITLDSLSLESIRTIAIANPKTAPYGKAAFQTLKNAKVLEKIKKKLIYASSISQALSFTLSHAQVGFIAKASLFSKKMLEDKKDYYIKDINKELYDEIKQGVVILKHAKNNKEVKAFYDFILSEKAKKIFASFGYIVL